MSKMKLALDVVQDLRSLADSIEGSDALLSSENHEPHSLHVSGLTYRQNKQKVPLRRR